MDKFLADLYGTGDLVKQAAAETEVPQELVDDFTEKVGSLCKSAGVDPANLSEKEVTEMWDGYVGAVQKQAAENPYANMTKQAFDEADAMGRIMAHSYVNELNGIEKEAGKGWEAVKAGFKGIKPALKEVAATGLSSSERAGSALKAGRTSSHKGRAMLAGMAAAPVAVGGGATAAALKLKKHLKEKKSSLSEVIEKRAYDILAANGLVHQDGTPATPQEAQKLAEEAQEPEKKEEEKKEEEEKKDEEEKQALDQAALSYLSDLGYPVAE